MVKPIITLDYYNGAYGPTIRIATNSLEALEQTGKLFMELSKELVEARLDEYLTVLDGSVSLHLRRSNENKMFKNPTIITHQDLDNYYFIWSMSAPDWEECTELIQALVQDKQPGHQYLTTQGVDNVLVEISYNE